MAAIAFLCRNESTLRESPRRMQVVDLCGHIWYTFVIMKAWMVTSPHNLELVEGPSESAGEGCVKIKVLRSIISAPDINVYSGKADVALPVCPGGSCVGMVIETGDNVGEFTRGDRVYVRSQKSCGTCASCRAGKSWKCENMKIRGYSCDGFMRDFAVIPASDCVKIPDRIKSEEAVFIDYISIAVQTIAALDVDKGDYLAITGASTLGIILGQVALYYQAVPIIIDSDAEALEVAKSLGLYYTIDASETDPKTKIFHITGGNMAERVAHMASSDIPLTRSIDFTARGGKLAIIGRYGCVNTLPCSLENAVRNNLTIACITNGAKNNQVAINMLVGKAVSVTPLITGETTFADVPAALKEENEIARGHMKTLIKFD